MLTVLAETLPVTRLERSLALLLYVSVVVGLVVYHWLIICCMLLYVCLVVYHLFSFICCMMFG